MRKFMKAILLLSLALALVFTACGQGSNEQASTETNTSQQEGAEQASNDDLNEELIYVAREINSTLDPTKPQSDGYLRRVGAIEALFYAQNDGSIVPWLAEGAEQVDPNTWNINLRENAKFWSGKAVKADVVVAALERARELNSSSASALRGLEFEALDDYTLQVKTEYANTDVPLSLISVSIVNPELDYTSVDQTDLTGMYKIVEFNPKQSLVLTRNEDYWGDKPTIKNIIFEEILDDESRLMAALSGRADIVSDIPTTGGPRIEQEEGLNLLASNPSGTLSVFLNHQHPPLDDVRVRQALNWGLDRNALVDVHTGGYGMAVSTWLGSNPMYGQDKNAVYDKYDPAKAEDLLAQAGWVKGDSGLLEKDGQTFDMKLYTWGSEKVLGEAIQNQWTALGVNVDLHHVDYSVIDEARNTDDWDGLVETWNHFGHMYSIVSNHFGPEGSLNYGKYTNPQLDALLEELLTNSDKEREHEIVSQINLLVAEEGVLVPMTPRPTLIAIKDNLEGFQIHFIQSENYINNQLKFVE